MSTQSQGSQQIIHEVSPRTKGKSEDKNIEDLEGYDEMLKLLSKEEIEEFRGVF